MSANGVPSHVGLIMDGNGRWATAQGLSRIDGHKAGEEALYDLIEGAIDLGINWLTAYAFSTENWRRSIDEVKFLMSYPSEVLLRRIDQLEKLGVRIHIAGRRDKRMPASVVRDMENAVEQTKKNKNLNLVLAYNYGGRAEIVDSVKALVAEGTSSRGVTEKSISKNMYVPEMPDVDLIVRTSGEQRTSNFLIWQAIYAEWVFIEKSWPDMRRADLVEAIDEYKGRQRRFGSAN